MITRQSAFIKNNKHLKGALHCHTTRSDGPLPPEKLIEVYYDHGFDFIALTDHNIYNRVDFAPELPITVIPGCEGNGGVENGKGFRTYHTVMLGSTGDSNGFLHDERMKTGEHYSPTGKVTCSEEYQPYLDMLHEKGNITIYCHPEWSATPARLFENMKGNFAMEIWNTGCVIENYMDRDAAYWDELLGQGKRIFGVATDDGHSMKDLCGGWVMVNSENDVDSILSALEAGDFYSSCGPEIYDFYVEDGVAHVKCSPCSMVRFQADKHPTCVKRGDGVTEASLEIGSRFDYLRVTVTDADGKMAWTNPIFLND